MEDEKLKFDRTCHVLYSKACKKQIQDKIALHYQPAQRGGTYDCIALMAYYVICKSVTSLDEIEEMEGNLFLTAFRKLKFVDVNKPFLKRLMYFHFYQPGNSVINGAIMR